VNLRVAIVVALAIVAHDSSDGLNTMMLVTRGEKPRRTDFLFLGMDAIAPVIGAILALRFLPSPKWLAIFLALASGFFLYTATSDLLPEAHRRSPSLSVTILTIVGVLIMALAVGMTRLDYAELQRKRFASTVSNFRRRSSIPWSSSAVRRSTKGKPQRSHSAGRPLIPCW